MSDNMQVIGKHETQLSENGEVDLHKHAAYCVKNPGHRMFIPSQTFSLHDLPEDHQDNDLYQLIKATSNLTVRIDVKKTSGLRPEFYPDTKVPYPFYTQIGKSSWKFGTGQIFVYKYKDGRGIDASGSERDLNKDKYVSKFDKSSTGCPCTKCQHSDQPSNEWWEVFVRTATHVVFDNDEANHTTCQLFNDDGSVWSLQGLTVHYVNVKEDRCLLKYVTCDKLGDQLYNMEVDRGKILIKVRNKYKTKSDDNLCFIVSHPHGCEKKVTIGHVIHNDSHSEVNQNFGLTRLTYSASTCPGSSGAWVNCLGFFGGHVHSGTYGPGVNFSAVGLFRK